MSRRVLQLSEGSVNTTKRPKVTLQTLNACTRRQTHACVRTNVVVLASRCLKIKERAAVVCPVGFFPVFTKHTHMISQLQVNLNTHNRTYIQCQECCRATVTNMRRKMMQKDVKIMIKSAKSLAVPAFFLNKIGKKNQEVEEDGKHRGGDENGKRQIIVAIYHFIDNSLQGSLFKSHVEKLIRLTFTSP